MSLFDVVEDDEDNESEEGGLEKLLEKHIDEPHTCNHCGAELVHERNNEWHCPTPYEECNVMYVLISDYSLDDADVDIDIN